MNLAELFAIEVPVAELVLRGSVVFWFLLLVFRFVLRRDIGALGLADVLLVVLLADAAQNAMAGGYHTVSEGLILLATIIGWNVLLDWLAFRFRVVHRFLTPQLLPLVRHGRFLSDNLRRELLTRDEVMGKLREQGVAHLSEVRHAYMESEGQISVIRYDRRPPPTPPDGRPTIPGSQ